jgi:hypothetical protein
MANLKLGTGFFFASHQPQVPWFSEQIACRLSWIPVWQQCVSGGTADCGEYVAVRSHGARFAAEREPSLPEDLDVRIIA